MSYTEAAAAPALKGMTSFLEITPEEYRRSRNFMLVAPRQSEEKNIVSSPGVETYPEDETFLDSQCIPPRLNPKAEEVQLSGLTSGDLSSPGYVSTPAVETLPTVAHLIPGRGRSKVRRTILAQDGHSLGEEAIYQLLWRSAKPENNDPNGSRTVRLGAADIGVRVNMAKKNVRQNISRLFEKLAIEVVQDFDPMSSQARLYRVFSYRQILERRRTHGLEFILRNKGVVFCTASGEIMHLSPAYQKGPGDESRTIRPAVPKAIRRALKPEPPLPQESAVSQEDLNIVARALNRHWPVDEGAAAQLLRECRRVCKDAHAEEIAFFVHEKTDMAAQNPKIINPTGLILTMVPRCFAGSTFETFRNRRAQAKAAEVERAAADRERQRQDKEALDAWHRKNETSLINLINDPSTSEEAKHAAERDLKRFARAREALGVTDISDATPL